MGWEELPPGAASLEEAEGSAPGSFRHDWYLRSTANFTPASCISAVKICEDATGDGFMWELICVVALGLWLLSTSPTERPGHLVGRGDLIPGREGEPRASPTEH